MAQFDASASAVGFMHQIRWGLLELLRASRRDPTLRLSLETYDDVSLLTADGSVETAQQLKHHGSPSPLTDGNKDLWSTLRVWLETPALKDPRGPELLLLTTSEIPDDTAAALISVTNRVEQIASAKLTDAATTLKAEATEKGRRAWLDATDAERLGLLKRVRIIGNSPSINDVDNLVRAELYTNVRAEHLDSFLEQLWGWWLEMSVRLLTTEKGKGKTVSASQLSAKMQSLRDKYVDGMLPLDPAYESFGEEELSVHRDKAFVKQMTWVGISTTGRNMRKALLDYHRAFAQTAKWADDGDLLDGELTTYEKRLVEEWEIQFENMIDQLALSGQDTETARIQAGRDLFNRLYDMQEVVIRPTFTEPFLTNGMRHLIADKGDLGWHPEFREKIRELVGAPA
ncbi:hypothetical protein G3T36_18510 [Diaminobutyricibacter tongyongensis]|uniref:ABC-three component systems C-terminal domain-containing protein n=1 Tax=Leifsonia tongyongensis TaxID=1268043 RepID=A0A6L9Y2J1_9MICO|nr:ABC-three component system protein [Diaminobutyricibacter tongyongensis]NEN07853.1 hypothetical protein [Diaminobutyricibacter tongyongensis]